jgi:DNA-binding NtrC family response regulator
LAHAQTGVNYASVGDSNQMSVIKEIEKQMILKRLAANNGNQKRTAIDLGMPKSTLHDRIRSYEINLEEFKP